MGTIKGNILIIGNKEYTIRYITISVVVCDTDELEGKFGDEFPIENLS